jgi:hypothetical protein
MNGRKINSFDEDLVGIENGAIFATLQTERRTGA